MAFTFKYSTKAAPFSLFTTSYHQNDPRYRLSTPIVDVAVWYWSDPAREMHQDQASIYPYFFFDIALAFKKAQAEQLEKGVQLSPLHQGALCRYHERAERKGCYLDMF